MLVTINTYINDANGLSNIKNSQHCTDISLKFFFDKYFYDEDDSVEHDLIMTLDINSGVVRIFGKGFSYGMPVDRYDWSPSDKKIVSTVNVESYPPQLRDFVSTYLDLNPVSDAKLIEFMEKIRKIYEFYIKKLI